MAKMKSSRSRARSEPKGNAAEVVAAIDAAEHERVSKPDVVSQWLTSGEHRRASKLLAEALDRRNTFESDRTALQMPACSLPPVV